MAGMNNSGSGPDAGGIASSTGVPFHLGFWGEYDPSKAQCGGGAGGGPHDNTVAWCATCTAGCGAKQYPRRALQLTSILPWPWVGLWPPGQVDAICFFHVRIKLATTLMFRLAGPRHARRSVTVLVELPADHRAAQLHAGQPGVERHRTCGRAGGVSLRVHVALESMHRSQADLVGHLACLVVPGSMLQ
eukprot:gene15751-biopygen15765